MELREIRLKGFTSIKGEPGEHIPLGKITVLLGANGSGKSNLISFFQMLRSMTAGALQQYAGKQGASRLLFYGPKISDTISFELHFESKEALGTYCACLSYGLPDRLFLSEERIRYRQKGEAAPQEYSLENGGAESQLGEDQRETSNVLYKLLSGIRTYQFHDTSDTAKIKGRGYVDDAGYLHSDGGNLAAFLKAMKEHDAHRKYYNRIVRHIQRIMPQFGDFEFAPIPGREDYTRLNWRDSSGIDYLFDPHQISDGALRFMALATLLLQPPELLPKFIIMDEPELGLHPAAIAELAGIVRIAAQKTQILLATQSTRLADEFAPEEIVIVERDEKQKCSVFKKLDVVQLKDWLDRYSLSELWEKNVLGGQP